jgi:hypothetical protein
MEFAIQAVRFPSPAREPQNPPPPPSDTPFRTDWPILKPSTALRSRSVARDTSDQTQLLSVQALAHSLARRYMPKRQVTASFSLACALFCKHRGVGPLSFDFEPSTLDSFHSPLCFHNLTNCFSRNPFRLITFQIARGGVPPLKFQISDLRSPTLRKLCAFPVSAPCPEQPCSLLKLTPKAQLTALCALTYRGLPRARRVWALLGAHEKQRLAAGSENGCGLYLQPT